MCKVIAVLGALIFLSIAAPAQEMSANTTLAASANPTQLANLGKFSFGLPRSSASPWPRPAPPYAASGEFDVYTWQVSLGYSFVHLQYVENSSINYNGIDSSVSYFFNQYVAAEGNVTPGFGSHGRTGAKFLLYGGGVRVARRSGRRWEPWGHVTVGRANVYPQTASPSTGGLAIQSGGGYDYRLTPRLSVRGEGDWIHSRLFNASQNNLKFVTGFVFNF